MIGNFLLWYKNICINDITESELEPMYKSEIMKTSSHELLNIPNALVLDKIFYQLEELDARTNFGRLTGDHE